MLLRRGIPVCAGYAIGKAFVLGTEEYLIPEITVPPQLLRGEVRRFLRGASSAIQELQIQLDTVVKKIGVKAGGILKGYMVLLKDSHFIREVTQTINENRFVAEYALSRVIKRKLKSLQDWGSGLFAEKVQQDLLALERILLRHLAGVKVEDLSHLTQKVILVAHDLSPAQTLFLNKKNIIGILTDIGSKTSHSAIIASSLGIPAVVGLGTITTDISAGDMVILDGSSGTVIVNPDEDTLKRYGALERNFYLLERKLSEEFKDLPAETTDGCSVQILGSIELPDEVESALQHGAEGIGLYRTEYLYLDHNLKPTESDHIQAYLRVASILGDRKFTIRTLDLGADKMSLDGVSREANPFLGTRAIRLCLQHQDIFKTQLKSILKASSKGNISILFPMISSESEIVQIKRILQDVKNELRADGIRFKEDIPIGILIEVPSAALIIDLLAPHVDFFSIGTNDLIAYLIAVDRLNERVASLYQPTHPAILRLLSQIIKTCQHYDKPVSVCGEISSDVLYTMLLLGIGLKVFSVVPPVIPEIKRVIRSVSMDEARDIAEKVLTFTEAEEIQRFLKEELQKRVPDIL
jgi:phosphotransferase system enzyme I (PtsI)